VWRSVFLVLVALAAALTVVRAEGRYAEVHTGMRCSVREQSRGLTLLFRRDGSSWALKETTEWDAP
jgi:hypothetical protein